MLHNKKRKRPQLPRQNPHFVPLPIQKQAVRVAWAVRERLVHFYRHKKAGRSVKNAAAGLTYYWLSLGKNNCTLLSWG